MNWKKSVFCVMREDETRDSSAFSFSRHSSLLKGPRTAIWRIKQHQGLLHSLDAISIFSVLGILNWFTYLKRNLYGKQILQLYFGEKEPVF